MMNENIPWNGQFEWSIARRFRAPLGCGDPGKLSKGNESPGIENEGNFMSLPMGDTQWASLVILCIELCRALSVQPSKIRGHREFSRRGFPR